MFSSAQRLRLLQAGRINLFADANDRSSSLRPLRLCALKLVSASPRRRVNTIFS
jgi:hypothetical protein